MYNPTCFFTGEKSNLKMHPMRNENGDMIGWIFVQNAIEMKDVKINHQWEIPDSVQKTIDHINGMNAAFENAKQELQRGG